MEGMDEGLGVIHLKVGPHAALLAYITTDMVVLLHSLQSVLTYAVDCSFNSISVNRDMSPNNTIVVFANGASTSEAGDTETDKAAHEAPYVVFQGELMCFAQELTQLVVLDSEGATKFVTISVTRVSSNANTQMPQPPMRTKPAATLVPCKRKGLGRRRKVK